MASFTLNNSLESLDRELKDEFGLQLTPEQRGEIWEEVARTGNEDVRSMYWGKFGKDIVKKAKAGAVKETAAKIAGNSQSYKGPENLAAGSVTQPEPAFGSPEWNDKVTKMIEKRMKG